MVSDALPPAMRYMIPSKTSPVSGSATVGPRPSGCALWRSHRSKKATSRVHSSEGLTSSARRQPHGSSGPSLNSVQPSRLPALVWFSGKLHSSEVISLTSPRDDQPHTRPSASKSRYVRTQKALQAILCDHFTPQILIPLDLQHGNIAE